MKKILFLISITFLLLQSCSSSNSEETNNTADSKVLILGKWNLVSDKMGTANNPIESITTCQKAYWQFDFKNNSELVMRTTSDDPLLTSSQCEPAMRNYTYSIDQSMLIMTPVNSTPVNTGYEARTLKIKSLSSTQLVLRAGNDNDNTFREFTFKKG
jgi:hypothetical protein